MSRLLEFFDRMPPCVCRLVARGKHGRRGLSVRELAARSGLSKDTISRLSRATSWREHLRYVAVFSEACGVDFWRLAGPVRFLKRGGWEFLRKAAPKQRAMYERILKGKG